MACCAAVNMYHEYTKERDVRPNIPLRRDVRDIHIVNLTPAYIWQVALSQGYIVRFLELRVDEPRHPALGLLSQCRRAAPKVSSDEGV